MSFPVRCTLFSLFVHAVGAAVLCVLPIAATQRFTSAGQQRVVAIQLSVASVSPQVDPPQILPVTIEPPRVVDLPPPDRSQETPHHASFEPSGSTPIPPPPDSFDRRPDMLAPLKRPSVAPADVPNVDATVAARPPRKMVREVTPPTIDAIPVPQSVGLSPETPVDFSSNPPPQYPAGAAQNGLEGTVLLRLRVDRNGTVTDVEVIESSGHRSLDQAAVDAVSRWKGHPAQRFGRPVASEEVLPVRFRL
ncbi:transport protein TonB [Stieleria maiorica]|uniref:Transport protein TonB n=1 Tax=Stieleria maiorica TaxID=2795974 RepID=A0A5B9MDL0_9BACT|nr:energy transducer TonB [Stieleria maiorica]QEF99168.1 transport protein TonB [Stieleria maiorica]